MNVLVAYFSQSGNTEKIAKAIWEEASRENEACLKKLEEVSAEDFADYDVVFIGSPPSFRQSGSTGKRMFRVHSG